VGREDEWQKGKRGIGCCLRDYGVGMGGGRGFASSGGGDGIRRV